MNGGGPSPIGGGGIPIDGGGIPIGGANDGGNPGGGMPMCCAGGYFNDISDEVPNGIEWTGGTVSGLMWTVLPSNLSTSCM